MNERHPNGRRFPKTNGLGIDYRQVASPCNTIVVALKRRFNVDQIDVENRENLDNPAH